tara:strand:+ start:384 stop:758 length:375 start_codon:yes stop_codon:yes gene_type:complete
MKEQVKVVMQNALLSTSKSMNVDLINLRIQMRLSNNGIDCYSMDKTEIIGNLSWNKILGIKYLAFKGIIVSSVEDKLKAMAINNKIEMDDVNVRVSAINPNGEPTLHLFNSGKVVETLDIKELV